MIRVLVIASSEVVRAGLVSLVEQNGEGTLVVTGTSDRFGQRSRGDADVILLDAEEPLDESLSDFDGTEPIPVVVLTNESPITVLQDSARAGVRAVIPRSATAAEMMAAINAAACGLITMPAAAWGAGLPARRSSPDSPAVDSLTARESEVLRMLAEGHANKTIAWKLGISEHTVKFHISAIFTKLNVSSRTEAVTAGIRLGLIML